MGLVTLKYGATEKEFTALSVRGLDDVDEVRFFVAENCELPDGSLFQRIPAFRRVITIDLGVLLVKSDRVWLSDFMDSSDKHIIYGTEDVPVVLEDPEGYENEWPDGLEAARYYVLKLEEMNARATVPDMWYTYTYKTDPEGRIVTDPEGRPQLVRN
jgi:hypothetical protein